MTVSCFPRTACAPDRSSVVRSAGRAGGRAQSVARRRRGSDRRFTPSRFRKTPIKIVQSEVAQWLACWAHNPKVRGSKPRFANLPAGHTCVLCVVCCSALGVCVSDPIWIYAYSPSPRPHDLALRIMDYRIENVFLDTSRFYSPGSVRTKYAAVATAYGFYVNLIL